MNAGAKIRKCLPEDLPQLLGFALKTFLATYEHLNDPIDFQKYISKAFTKTQFKKEMVSPGSDFYFLVLEETVIGYIKLNLPPDQTDINDPKSIEVERA